MRVRVETAGVDNKVNLLWDKARCERINFKGGLCSTAFIGRVFVRIVSATYANSICE